MHPEMTAQRSVLLFVLLLVLPQPLAAQEGEEWRSVAVSSVIDYRVSVLADTTAKFDACRIARVAGGVERLAQPVRRWVAPCEAADAHQPGNRHLVLVDSVTGSEGEALAYVTVIRGEWVHRENYALAPHAGGPFMGVREVKLWGAVQAYPVRRSGTSQTP